MMRRSNPFENMESMFERMSRQFDEMSRQFDDSQWTGSSTRGMEVDVRDGDEEFVVVADLPGFEKEDIDLSITERALTISASRETETETDSGEGADGGEYLRRERRHESMHRTFRLPGDVTAEDAAASYKNGVLTVTLPKVTIDREDSRHIDIE
ncbi:Hsp20/alpha crystallin family protein [Halogeometricum sp. S1BR25-6]|uniref:Hsp20/alpha crystallin family protein n=1 Tax=Halogeometricum salsisoli TaxID=2950536 RepID=A0ABU2GAC1_9EURY|nr:Hsp20/alpha crystallin family protein [Halogeometricum sp. S1BR25-6]MDS0297704.1 Hsp20/alpha crystallin family protein [Halogeometricum sp. S1BR25-6]